MYTSSPSRSSSAPSQSQICNQKEVSLHAVPLPSSLPEHIVGEEAVAPASNPDWQPFWLRQAILTGFFGLFFCLAVIFGSAFWISRSQHGLFKARSDLSYFWRFGPAAVLTLVSIYWSRVELQSQRYIPLMDADAPKDLCPEGLESLAGRLFRSSGPTAYLIAPITLVSIMLKAQIVLSAGLIHLKPVNTQRQITIETMDSFQPITNLSAPDAVLAYYRARAAHDFEMPLPFGLTKGFAYQTFEERGTIDSPITAEVDGLFSNMTCLKVETCESEIINLGGHTNLSIALHFEDCDDPLVTMLPYLDDNGEPTSGPKWKLDLDLDPARHCSSLPQQNRQFLAMGVNLTPANETSSVAPELETCAAVLCSFTAWRSKVEVMDNGVDPLVTEMAEQDVYPLEADSWDTMTSSASNLIDGLLTNIQLTGIMGPVADTLLSRDENKSPSEISSFQSRVMEQAIKNLTSTIGPSLSHSVRNAETSQILGLRVQGVDRLHVNEPLSLIMIGLFGLSAAIVLWVMAALRRKKRFWHRDPATILGSITLFLDRDQSHTVSDEACSGSKGNSKEEYIQSTYSPLVLRPWVRVVLTLVTISIVTLLTVGLRVSDISDGFITITDAESYISLLWTSLPALVMLAITQYVSSCNLEIRNLATLSILSTRECSSVELDISLLDMLGYRALYHSLRLKAAATTLSQILAITTTFLTTLSAVLFTLKNVPTSKNITMQQQSWFGSRPYDPGNEDYQLNRLRVGSLVLAQGVSNLTYPANTYEDLLFPALQLDDAVDWAEGTSVTVALPAAKLVPECHRLPESEYYLNVTSLGGSITQHSSYSGKDGLDCFTGPGPFGALDHSTNTSFMAASFPSPGNPIMSSVCKIDPPSLDSDEGLLRDLYTPWRLETYAWGKVSLDRMVFEYATAWQCNYSWAEVITETTLIRADGGDLAIDLRNPPIQNLDKIQPWSTPFSVPDSQSIMVFWLAPETLTMALPDTNMIDYPGLRTDERGAAFKSFLEPVGPIKVENLGDRDFEAQILEALQFNFALVSAQTANLENRLAVDEQSVMPPWQIGGLTPLQARINRGNRERLVQNAIPTYILVAILSLVIVVNIWALVSTCLRRVRRGRKHRWLLDMDLQGLAPKDFNSIDLTESLLRGSNIGSALPTNAFKMEKEKVHVQLENKRFRMGWFDGGGEVGKVYTIGEIGDENFRFLYGKDFVGKGSSQPFASAPSFRGSAKTTEELGRSGKANSKAKVATLSMATPHGTGRTVRAAVP